jgi:UDP-glucose 4-epimerase
MTVLVTGGAGYIGSHTVQALRDAGRRVVVLDSLELGHRAAVRDAPLVVGSTGDRELVRRVMEEHDVSSVIHFAAYKAPAESMRDPAKYFDNNVSGSLSLLREASAKGVGAFVFSSTCAVYGTPDHLPVDEQHRVHPESPYGMSKLMVEQMLEWFDQCLGLRYVSLRYFNAAGASAGAVIGEDWDRTENLIPLVMKAILGRRPPLQVFGTDYPTPDGTAIRDYVHVIDLADAHVKALDYLEWGEPSTVINLGTGVGSSVREVLSASAAAAGQPVPAADAPRRAGDPVAVYANNDRARTLLGWAPTHGLDEIVKSAWAWHSSHPDGYGSS